MKSYLSLLVFCGEVAAENPFKCGGYTCKITECCVGGGALAFRCGVCPAHEDSGSLVSDYTTEGGYPFTLKKPRHIASPDLRGLSKAQMDAQYPDLAGPEPHTKDNGWKYDLGQWKQWTTAAKNNKGLHWDVIMGTMYTKHIEKEQKTLERLSNDVKSQLNSMYLGKKTGCIVQSTLPQKCQNLVQKDEDDCQLMFLEDPSEKLYCEEDWAEHCPAACGQCESKPERNPEIKDPKTCLSRGGVWNGDTHDDSPIQISMKDTKNAYTALVDCLKASVSSHDYPTYLDLVQRRGSNVDSTQYLGYAAQDRASFGEDSDLTNYPARRLSADPSLNADNHTTDYLLLLKTKQAHYNLQSSYECSNEEMNFEVRLYKMSKLENRYKLLYLYCKCDLTTQIKKFRKMVHTLCTGATNVDESGHCYKTDGTTQKRHKNGEIASSHDDFLTSIAESECNIDEAFCPEHVFYYTADGMSTHSQAPCSKCIDLGGKHSHYVQDITDPQPRTRTFVDGQE